MKILLSTHPYQGLGRNLSDLAAGEHTVVVRPRTSYQSRDISRPVRDFLQAVSLLRQAREFDALVLVLPGLEGLIVSCLRRTLAPHLKLVHFDPGRILGLPPPLLKIAGKCLSPGDAFACVRRGDISLLSRHCRIPENRTSFVPFPIDEAVLDQEVSDEGYIYAAGLNRDWKVLIEALQSLPYPAVLSGAEGVAVPPAQAGERLRILPQQHPREGRQLMSRARLVVVPLPPTNVLSGQLVLLDALAMGKTLVASDAPGTCDYLIQEKTAVLVPPGDPRALEGAISRLMENSDLRAKIGQAGKDYAIANFCASRCLQKIVDICVSF